MAVSTIYPYLDDLGNDTWAVLPEKEADLLYALVFLDKHKIHTKYFVIEPDPDNPAIPLLSTLSKTEFQSKFAAYLDADTGVYNLPEGTSVQQGITKHHEGGAASSVPGTYMAQLAKEDYLPKLVSQGNYAYLGIEAPLGDTTVQIDFQKSEKNIAEEAGVLTWGQAKAITKYLSDTFRGRTQFATRLFTAAKAVTPVAPASNLNTPKVAPKVAPKNSGPTK